MARIRRLEPSGRRRYARVQITTKSSPGRAGPGSLESLRRVTWGLKGTASTCTPARPFALRQHKPARARASSHGPLFMLH
eukprot:540161-Rhodomonas_salina.1